MPQYALSHLQINVPHYFLCFVKDSSQPTQRKRTVIAHCGCDCDRADCGGGGDGHVKQQLPPLPFLPRHT